MTRRNRVGRIFLGSGAVVVLLAVALTVRLWAAPLDVSGNWSLPNRVKAVKERDDLAYPAHATLGTILQHLGADSAAVGVQWLKAGAHARTPEEIDRAGNGLAKAVRQSSAPAQVAEEICSYLHGGATDLRQASALDDAGVPCTG